MNQDGPFNLLTLHRDGDGILPYLCCPWCGYTDVSGEFVEYRHPHESTDRPTGSTECGQCGAAGPTALFVLHYNREAHLGKDEEFKELYLSQLPEEEGGV